jgi:hypothetical protein
LGAKRSYGRDKFGRITQVTYTERRRDGKVESRHYTGYGKYTGKTVGDSRGRSVHYNRYGQRD